MKTISIVTSGRPQYLSQVVDSWTRVKGFNNYKLIAFIEPGPYAEIESNLFREVAGFFKDASITINQQLMGLSPNTLQGLKAGLEQCDGFHIHTEDDILLAPDVLDFMEWADANYKDDKQLFQATAYCANNNKNNDSDWFKVVRKCKFGPLCWGTWTDRLHEIVDYGERYWNVPGVQGEWDVDTNHRVRNNRDSIWPLVSRSLHIGLVGLHSQGPPGSKQYNASDITKRKWAINIPRQSIYTNFTQTEDYFYDD
jgi:hypothetical protein